MPPKKKVQKPNGFMLFMIDMRPRLESDGHKFPGGLADVHPVCTPLWNNLTSEQKAVYNQRAKGGPLVKEEKLDTRGVPISWKEREEEKKIMEKSQIFQKIEDMVKYFSTQEKLLTHHFHFAHFNYAVGTDEKEWPPCELAIVKYSLAEGIAGTYHEFVDPGKIRIGYSYEAQEYAAKTHKIPAIGFKLFNANYIGITNSIKNMLTQNDGGVAPLFVLEAETPQAIYILDWLIENSCRLDSNYDRTNPFKVYNLNKLVYELRRHADLNNPRLQFTSTAQVGDKLTNGAFDFCPNMACTWHEEDDNVKFCSLNRVRNYAFTISDLCCEYYDLALLPNRHCPASVADESRYVVLPKMAKREPEPIEVKNDAKNEPSGDAPRLPQTISRVFQNVGPRVAANFGAGGVPGAGRGILGSSATALPKASDFLQENEATPPAGRGRGRGILLN